MTQELETFKRKKAVFQSRDKQKLVSMANKCSIWVRKDTHYNMKKILDFLEKEKKQLGRTKKHSFLDISRETGLNPHSVSSAIYIHTLRKEPKMKMWGERMVNPKLEKGRVKTIMRVILL